MKRVVLEMGVGFDLRGGDMTKAAVRAVHDAIHRTSLNVVAMGTSTVDEMLVHVLIGVPEPARVDPEQVLSVLPYGQKSIEVVSGGLAVPSEREGDFTIVAIAAITVSIDAPD